MTISWNDVELAESYPLVINDEGVDLTATRGETAAVNEYKFVGEYNPKYTIKVIAPPAADTDYRASEAIYEITTEAQEALATPTITATLENHNEVTFTWEAVEKAESYIVTLDGEEVTPTTNFEYSFVGDYETTYVIKVVATTTDEDYIASEATAEITTEAEPVEYIYLDATEWKADDARYEVIVSNSRIDWNPDSFEMTDSNNDGIYEVVKPEGYTYIKFSRTTPSQYIGEYTETMEFPDGENLFIITDGGDWWNDAEGYWSTME